MRSLKAIHRNQGLSDDVCNKLREASDRTFECSHFHADHTDSKIDISILVGDNPAEIPIRPGQVWSNQAMQDVAGLSQVKQLNWKRHFEHCNQATTAKPSATWRKSAASNVEAIGVNEFRRFLAQWFELVSQPNPITDTVVEGHPLFIHPHNQTVLRGLVWSYLMYPDENSARVLSQLAETTFKKIPQVGARGTIVANACTYALENLGSDGSVAQLTQLKTTVKGFAARKRISKGIETAADQKGVSAESLQETTVPDFGMQAVGSLTIDFGEFSMRLNFVDGRLEQTWIHNTGREQKSVPSIVKREYPAQLKELKTLVKELKKTVSAQKTRIENLLPTYRKWPLVGWRQHYLDHKIVGTVSRRLIWNFIGRKRTQSGIFWEDKIVGSDGKKLRLPATVETALWHPVEESVETVLAWREFIERRQICQPFKQAHREVYLVTKAEKSSRTYSNRHAGHVLQQTSLRGVAQSRDWK